MTILDYWTRLGSEIKFYCSENFESIPRVPGVYAWFYPLQIFNHSYHDFIMDVNKAMAFESSCGDSKKGFSDIKFSWDMVNISLEFENIVKEPGNLSTWNKVLSEEQTRLEFRGTLLKSSIFLPPLYIGKTRNLNLRIYQHLNNYNSDNSSFHNRFIEYAQRKGLYTRSISELLVCCVEIHEKTMSRVLAVEDLLEEILKNVVKPPYSIK